MLQLKPEKFEIAIIESRLQEMRQRIRTTSWADDIGNADWDYGVERSWLRQMAEYWAEQFEWRAMENEMNALPHWRVMIDDLPIHYIHVRGKGPDPRPLILTHGWPWTFWDWRHLILPLSDPAAHGGNPADAFDIVVASLPGVAFSAPLTRTGVDPACVAGLWVKLMCDILGYRSFFAGAGDFGVTITTEIARRYPARLRAMHLAFPILPNINPFTIDPEAFAPEEQWMVDRRLEIAGTITSHVAVQSADPQTLAYALSDSPIGTAAWIWERRRAWSDCGGDVLATFGRDFLCTTASLYWLTNTIGSSLRIYREYFRNGWKAEKSTYIEVPTAIGIAPKELVFAPRKLVEKHMNLARWRVFEKGGHFGPAEQPSQLIEDFREFFRDF